MVPTIAERYNLVRWAGGTGAIVESHFLKLHLSNESSLWIRYTLRRHGSGVGPAVGAMWAVMSGPDGHAGGCDVHDEDAVSVGASRFYLRIGDGELSMGRAVGRVRQLCDRSGRRIPGDLSWDLAFGAGAGCLVHFPFEAMYDLGFPRNKIASPHVSTRFRGQVTLAGRTFEIKEAPGMQGHNWGTGVAPHWVWVHGNDFDGEDAVFEAVSSRISIAGHLVPPLTIFYLKARGREVLLNGPVAMAAADSHPHGLGWRFGTSRDGISLSGEFQAKPEATVCLDYISSDGGTIRVHNSNLANARVRVEGLAGGPFELASSGRATLEMGGGAATADLPVMFRG
jgi:hypothetical protein